MAESHPKNGDETGQDQAPTLLRPEHTPKNLRQSLARRLWHEKGWTLAKIARYFGVTRQTIAFDLGFPGRSTDLHPQERLRRARLDATLRRWHKFPQIHTLADLALLAGASRQWTRDRLRTLGKLEEVTAQLDVRQNRARELRLRQRMHLLARKLGRTPNAAEIYRYVGRAPHVKRIFGGATAFQLACGLPPYHAA